MEYAIALASDVLSSNNKFGFLSLRKIFTLNPRIIEKTTPAIIIIDLVFLALFETVGLSSIGSIANDILHLPEYS